MRMRFVPTKVHGAIDYVTAPALVAAPDLLRLDGARASTIPPRAAGTAAAVYSALTDYELGVRRMIPMRAHVALDAVGGTAVALAPWIFGSARRGTRHWLPHAIVGATELALALTTKEEPPRARLRRWADTAGSAFTSLPPAARIAVVAAPLAVAAVALAGRRRLWQAAALVAEGVEEVADAIEDATDAIGDAGDAVEDFGDAVEDAAEDMADAAKEKAERYE